MLSLKTFRENAEGLHDLLSYAALVDSGVVQCKDGSLMAGFYYQGPDIASATDDERNHLTSRVNAALSRLGSGWTTWNDSIRKPSPGYPATDQSAFPDEITRLIDEERRAQFMQKAAHYETTNVMVFMYTPPLLHNSKVVDLLYDERATDNKASGNHYLAHLNKTLNDFEDALANTLKLRRMETYTVKDAFNRVHRRDDLVNYLNFVLTGLTHQINLPPCPMYMDGYLGGQDLWPGDIPRIGEQYIACVSLDGMPQESYPNILEVLNKLPIPFRLSLRMRYLDQHDASEILKKQYRQWVQKARGFWSQVFKMQGGMVNDDALQMAREAEASLAEVQSGTKAFGYCTTTVILMGSDKDTLIENARLVVREVNRLGFNSRIETINAMEAWLGSLPGHPIPNTRKPLIHSAHLSDLLPLATVWPGHESCPSPMYSKGLPPLLYAATTGATPFRLNLHVSDVGHTLIFGPTGAGKSTLLATLIAQFRRYPNATICAFDKGRSLWALTEACGGRHYDIAATDSTTFAPLAMIDTANDLAWAESWIATCYELQANRPATPEQRQEIHRAMVSLQQTAKPEHRSLTEFASNLQDDDLRKALTYYKLDGSLQRLLDSQEDGIQDSSFTVFEIEELMGLGDKAAIPVMLYLFRRFEKSLNGQPALLVLDEAWVMLGHPVFREKIREWLKVLRKANCAVVLATQSLSDAVRSGIFDVLIESCPTKILLPNEEAGKPGTDSHPGPLDLYKIMGLNDTEINLIKHSAKKQDYYYTSSEGRRLFRLGLGPIALSFVAVSDKETLAHLKQLKQAHGSAWPKQWLQQRGVAV